MKSSHARPAKHYLSDFYVRWSAFALAICLVSPAEKLLASVPTPTSTLQTVALSGDLVPGLGETRFPINFHPTVFLEPRINNAGQLLFLGGLPVSNGFAVLSGEPDSLRLVAATSQPAPDTEAGTTFDAFYDAPLAFNNRGEVAFVARLRGPNISVFENSFGIWTESAGGVLRKAGRMGEQVPGMTEGVRFTEFEGPRISNDGRMTFRAGFDVTPGPGLQSTGVAHWSETSDQALHLLVQNGLPAPGIPQGIITESQVTLTLGGEFYVLGTVRVPTTPFSMTNIAAVWRGETYESLNLVFDGRRPPPNIPGFVRFVFEFLPQANETGHVAGNGALLAFENNQSVMKKGLFVIEPDDAIRSVAIQNSQPPDTPSGSFYTDNVFLFEINDVGRTAFTTSLALPGDFFQRRAVFAEGNDGQLRLVAMQNTHAPGTPAGVHFGNPIWSSQVNMAFEPPAFNNTGQVAFLGELEGPGVTPENDVGLWVTDRNGILTLLAREGDPLQVAPGDFRTVAELLFVGGEGDAQNRLTGLNDDGLVTFSARFTDGTSGLFISHVVAVPEPSTAVLLVATIAMTFRPFGSKSWKTKLRRMCVSRIKQASVATGFNVAAADQPRKDIARARVFDGVSGFNVAAADQPRKGVDDRDVREEIAASMWPRLINRGRGLWLSYSFWPHVASMWPRLINRGRLSM